MPPKRPRAEFDRAAHASWGNRGNARPLDGSVRPVRESPGLNRQLSACPRKNEPAVRTPSLSRPRHPETGAGFTVLGRGVEPVEGHRLRIRDSNEAKQAEARDSIWGHSGKGGDEARFNLTISCWLRTKENVR